jgi:hypothetical protein
VSTKNKKKHYATTCSGKSERFLMQSELREAAQEFIDTHQELKSFVKRQAPSVCSE